MAIAAVRVQFPPRVHKTSCILNFTGGFFLTARALPVCLSRAGFNDGETSKTINIVTRLDSGNASFGRLYTGYGDEAASQFYNESSSSGSRNMNHRFNTRVEYNINPGNTLLINQRFSLQQTESASLSNAFSSLATGSQMGQNGTKSMVNQSLFG